MEQPILKVEGLKTHFPVGGGLFAKKQVVKAVNEVSFQVMQNETFGLVGESGCGKSTLGRTLVKIYEPTAGKIEFMGRDVSSLSGPELQDFRRNMQMIFQDPYASLNPRMTVGEIIREPMDIHNIGSPKEREEKVSSLLETVGLKPDHVRRYPHEFSGGMRQRVMIAMAIVCNPKLIIADEPTTALDVTVQAQVLGLMQDLQKKTNTSIILVTHNLGVVWKMCDNVMVMYAGKTVEYADVKTLYKDAQHPYTWGLLRSMPKITDDPSVPLASIPGTPPDLKLTGGSCNFYNRCKYCQEICKTECPPMREASPGHLVACHFTAEELKKIGGEEGD